MEPVRGPKPEIQQQARQSQFLLSGSFQLSRRRAANVDAQQMSSSFPSRPGCTHCLSCDAHSLATSSPPHPPETWATSLWSSVTPHCWRSTLHSGHSPGAQLPAYISLPVPVAGWALQLANREQRKRVFCLADS